MIQPNNLRNRWRRMRDAHEAYGFSRQSFREWYKHGLANGNSYSAEPHHANVKVTLRSANK